MENLRPLEQIEADVADCYRELEALLRRCESLQRELRQCIPAVAERNEMLEGSLSPHRAYELWCQVSIWIHELAPIVESP